VDEVRSLLFSINVKAFTTQAAKSLQSLISDFGRLRSEVESSGLLVEVNTEQAEESIRNLSERVGGLGEDAGDISIDADTSEADENIRNLTENLGNLGENAEDIDVDVNTDGAEESLRNLTDDLGSLGENAGDIEVDADTSEAGRNLRDLTGELGDLESDAGGIGDTFRKSFLAGIDSGNSFSSSLKSGIGDAFTYAGEKVIEFKDNTVNKIQGIRDSVVNGAQAIGNGFAHPIEAIKGGLGSALDSAKSKFINMVRGADDAADAAEDVGDAAADAEKDVRDFGNAADESGGKFEKMGGILKGIGAGILAATVAVGGFAAASISTGMEFDSAMSQVAATMGKSVDEIQNLRQTALEMGSTTAFSATEAAEGLNILAMAGLEAEDQIAAIPTVLDLAAAGGISLEQAASHAVGAVKGFSDEMENASYYADLIAKGATLANTNVADLGAALSKTSATAASYGQTADSVTLSLLRLADQNITGDVAATGLKRAMADLYTPTDDAKKALSELGVSVYDSSGKARDFNDIVGELGGALSGMSDEQANAYAATIFTAQGLDVFNKMTVASEETLEKFNHGLANIDGSAAVQAATQMDNLAGDITLFKSALEGAQIVIADQINPTLRKFVQFGGDAIGTLSTAFQEGGLSGAMGALGGILSDGLAMVIEMVPTLIDAGMQLLGALGQGILDNMPLIVEAAAQVVVMLATGIGSSLPELIPAVSETLLLVVETLLNNLPLILDAGLRIISGLAEGIIGALPVLIQGLPVLVEGIVGYLTKSLPAILEQGSEILMSLVTGIVDAIPMLAEQLPLIFESIATFATENLPAILDLGVQILTELVTGIIDSIPILVEQIPIIIDTAVTFLAENMPLIMEQGIQVITNLAMGIMNALPEFIAQVPIIITSIVGGLAENFPTLVETGVTMLLEFAGGIISAIPQLLAQLPAIGAAIVGGLAEIPGLVIDVGKNIVQGLWNGVSSMVDWAIDKIKGFGSSIVNGLKNFLGIHSPSTVFAEIGDNMALGLGEGFTSEMGAVEKDIKGAIPTNLDGPEIAIPDPEFPDISPDFLTRIGSNPEYGVGSNIESFDLPEGNGATYTVRPEMTDVQLPPVPDMTYGVSPVYEGIEAMGAAAEDVTYRVNPIIGGINIPNVADQSYTINPIVEDFNPPGYEKYAEPEDGDDGAPGGGNDDNGVPELDGGGPIGDGGNPPEFTFAPVVTIPITVEGNADREALEELKAELEAKFEAKMRELFEEFREEELQQAAVKHQFAF